MLEGSDMSTENSSSVPAILRPPRGAMRWKYWTLVGLVTLVIFMIYLPKTEPLDCIYLTVFSAVAVAGALYQCWEMWTLNSKRSPRWLGLLAAFGSAGMVALLLVLHDMKLFSWNHFYFEVPAALFCTVATVGAWLTERRKCVRIYAEVEGLVFMPNAEPSNLAVKQDAPRAARPLP